MKPLEIARAAREASNILAHAPTEKKNSLLLRLERLIRENRDYLFSENRKDLEGARNSGIRESLVERLRIDEKGIDDMRASLCDVAVLPDPVGEIGKLWRRPNGLLVGRMRIPVGVIMIIYESRPNVTTETFSLCLKSGNCVILKGGSEAFNSNLALHNLIGEALELEGFPRNAAQLVKTNDRAYIYELLKLDDYIDLIIPRGGEGLIRDVVERSSIPVLKHYKGVCHIYVDQWADMELGHDVCLNAKIQRPATCNALETLLVHEAVADAFLPRMAELFRDNGVIMKGCPKAQAIIGDMKKASENDWYEEYLDFIISIKVVGDMDEAIDHIRRCGSSHTESIITRDYDNAWRFLRELNSSLVLVNASTRLNDGFQLGLGAEMGISTTRLHAFGPMGLEELTITKFIAFGDGQLRE